MTGRISNFVFGLLAVLAAAALAAGCGGSKSSSGEPTALAAFNQFVGAGNPGGAPGGGGGGAFLAVAYSDELFFGAPTQQFPAELHMASELLAGAAAAGVGERAAGSGGAFTPATAIDASLVGLTDGIFWGSFLSGVAIPLPTSDFEYQVDQLDGQGNSLGLSNIIKTNVVTPSFTTFAITSPQNSFWLDPQTGNTVQPPSVPAPATVTWDPVGSSYVVWCLELDRNGFANGQSPFAALTFLSLTTTNSVDAASGPFLEPPVTASAFESGKEYIVVVIACDNNGFGNATTSDLQIGPITGAFAVQ